MKTVVATSITALRYLDDHVEVGELEKSEHDEVGKENAVAPGVADKSPKARPPGTNGRAETHRTNGPRRRRSLQSGR